MSKYERKPVKLTYPVGTIVDDLEIIDHVINKNNTTVCVCKCLKCGRIKEKLPNELRRHSGTTHSACGKGLKTKDPVFHTRWCGLKQRIYNPNYEHYDRYGGRGLTCDYDNFIDFYDDMYESWVEANKKYASVEIDRIDNNKGYVRGNLRWVDRTTNVNNSSKMRKFIGISPTGEKFFSTNQTAFAKEHNLSSKQINAVLIKRFKTTCGWKFYYID